MKLTAACQAYIIAFSCGCAFFLEHSKALLSQVKTSIECPYGLISTITTTYLKIN